MKLLFLVGLLIGMNSFMVVAELPPLVPRELLVGNPERTSPSLSPDGKRLAWLAPDTNNVLQVWVKTVGQEDDKIVEDSVTPIAKAELGLIIRKNAPKPEMSTVRTLRHTLLNAKSIALGDPENSASEVGVAAVTSPGDRSQGHSAWGRMSLGWPAPRLAIHVA